MRLGQKPEGGTVSVQYKTGDPATMATHAVAFGRNRRIGVRVTRGPDAMTLTRDASALESKYAPVDRLEVGEEYFMAAEPGQIPAIRSRLTIRGQTLNRHFRCNVAPGGVKITRLPDDATGATQARSRARETYDLSPLEHQLWVEFKVEAYQVNTVRAAIKRAEALHGWELHSRVRDSHIRVYRLDWPAEGPSAAPAPPGQGTAGQ